MIGDIKYFNDDRGFGFIKSEGGEFFVHISECHRAGIQDPRIGDRLEFDIEADRQGRDRAVNLRPLRGRSAAA